MRIAVVTPYLPWPADTGGKLRSYYLLCGLAQIHTVDLYSVCYGPTPNTGPLANLCRNMQIYPLGEGYSRSQQVRALAGALPQSVAYFHTVQSLAALGPQLQQGYDLLICDEIMMVPYMSVTNSMTANAPSTPRLLMRQKIDSSHYAEMARQRPWGVIKWLNWLEARRLRHYEVNTIGAFQAAAVCSADDAAQMRALAEHLRLEVIPNGADVDYFQPTPTPDPVATILFLGTMHYYPNIDAVQYFCGEILPLLRQRRADLQLLIVGHDPPPAIQALSEQPGVTVTGGVADVRPYLARSWVMVVPLRLGGGTRLKIAEALAAGLPVVSTSVGAQGLDVIDDEHLLLADTPADFAKQIERLLSDGSLRQTLGEAGRRLVESRYSWQALGRQFAKFCEEVSQP